MASIKIKVLKDIPGHKAGASVKVEVDRGVPLERFWRDRLRDAELDGCVEIVKSNTTRKPEGDK